MRASTIRRPFFVVLAFSLLSACFVTAFTNSSDAEFPQAQSTKSLKEAKRSPANNYGFRDDAPLGDWSAQSEMDIYQSNDETIPVVIAGITSYAGKGRWRKHVMIESAVLKNRADKAVKTIRFGWIIITDLNRKAYKNREAALAQGSTSFFDAELPPLGMKRLEFLDIDCLSGQLTLTRPHLFYN